MQFVQPEQRGKIERNISFVLTNEKNQITYCAAATIPVENLEQKNSNGAENKQFCLVFCSAYGDLRAYEQLLATILYDTCNNSRNNKQDFLQATVNCVIYGIPLPPKSRTQLCMPLESNSVTFSRPALNEHPRLDDMESIRLICSLMKPDAIVSLIGAVCTEQKILMVSPEASLLTALGKSLISLIYPLEWNHTFVPLLPGNLEIEDVIQSPCPLIVGCTARRFLGLVSQRMTSSDSEQSDCLSQTRSICAEHDIVVADFLTGETYVPEHLKHESTLPASVHCQLANIFAKFGSKSSQVNGSSSVVRILSDAIDRVNKRMRVMKMKCQADSTVTSSNKSLKELLCPLDSSSSCLHLLDASKQANKDNIGYEITTCMCYLVGNCGDIVKLVDEQYEEDESLAFDGDVDDSAKGQPKYAFDRDTALQSINKEIEKPFFERLFNASSFTFFIRKLQKQMVVSQEVDENKIMLDLLYFQMVQEIWRSSGDYHTFLKWIEQSSNFVSSVLTKTPQDFFVSEKDMSSKLCCGWWRNIEDLKLSLAISPGENMADAKEIQRALVNNKRTRMQSRKSTDFRRESLILLHEGFSSSNDDIRQSWMKQIFPHLKEGSKESEKTKNVEKVPDRKGRGRFSGHKRKSNGIPLSDVDKSMLCICVDHVKPTDYSSGANTISGFTSPIKTKHTEKDPTKSTWPNNQPRSDVKRQKLFSRITGMMGFKKKNENFYTSQDGASAQCPKGSICRLCGGLVIENIDGAGPTNELTLDIDSEEGKRALHGLISGGTNLGKFLSMKAFQDTFSPSPCKVKSRRETQLGQGINQNKLIWAQSMLSPHGQMLCSYVFGEESEILKDDEALANRVYKIYRRLYCDATSPKSLSRSTTVPGGLPAPVKADCGLVDRTILYSALLVVYSASDLQDAVATLYGEYERIEESFSENNLISDAEVESLLSTSKDILRTTGKVNGVLTQIWSHLDKLGNTKWMTKQQKLRFVHDTCRWVVYSHYVSALARCGQFEFALRELQGSVIQVTKHRQWEFDMAKTTKKLTEHLQRSMQFNAKEIIIESSWLGFTTMPLSSEEYEEMLRWRKERKKFDTLLEQAKSSLQDLSRSTELNIAHPQSALISNMLMLKNVLEDNGDSSTTSCLTSLIGSSRNSSAHTLSFHHSRCEEVNHHLTQSPFTEEADASMDEAEIVPQGAKIDLNRICAEQLPAVMAGAKDQDLILCIGTNDVGRSSFTEIMHLLRSEGRPLRMTVLRPSDRCNKMDAKCSEGHFAMLSEQSTTNKINRELNRMGHCVDFSRGLSCTSCNTVHTLDTILSYYAEKQSPSEANYTVCCNECKSTFVPRMEIKDATTSQKGIWCEVLSFHNLRKELKNACQRGFIMQLNDLRHDHRTLYWNIVVLFAFAQLFNRFDEIQNSTETTVDNLIEEAQDWSFRKDKSMNRNTFNSTSYHVKPSKSNADNQLVPKQLLTVSQAIQEQKQNYRMISHQMQNLIAETDLTKPEVYFRSLKQKLEGLLEERDNLRTTSFVNQGRIQVYIRVRPSKDCGINPSLQAMNANTIKIATDQKQGISNQRLAKENIQQQYRFDTIFSADSTQENVFDQVQPIVDGAIKGINGCIMAYGQTGTGKTYTMQGSLDSSNTQQQGVYGRVFHHFFHKKKRIGDHSRIRMSVLEMKSEIPSDLLGKSILHPMNCTCGGCDGFGQVAKTVEVRLQKRASGPHLEFEGACKLEITSTSQGLHYLDNAVSSRSISDNGCNGESSRSHLLTIIWIEKRQETASEVNRETGNSKLVLVDLAGSERLDKTNIMSPQPSSHKLRSLFSPKKEKQVPQATIEQTQFINSSLAALGNVVHALGNQQESSNGPIHVPYRDSKLTFILQDCLNGSSCTGVIVCVSPDEEDLSESVNSLRFASRLRTIKHLERPIDSIKDYAKKLADQKNSLQEEKAQISQELERTRKREEELKSVIAQQRSCIEELQHAQTPANTSQPLELVFKDISDNKVIEFMDSVKYEMQYRGLRDKHLSSTKRVGIKSPEVPVLHGSSNENTPEPKATPTSRRKKHRSKASQNENVVSKGSSKQNENMAPKGSSKEKTPSSQKHQLYDFNGRRIRQRKGTMPEEQEKL